jgi:hypothetical protein
MLRWEERKKNTPATPNDQNTYWQRNKTKKKNTESFLFFTSERASERASDWLTMTMVSDWLTMVSWRQADDLWYSLTEGWVVFTDGYVHGKTRLGEARPFILEKNIIPFKGPLAKGTVRDETRRDETGRDRPISSISSRPHRPLCHWARLNQQHPTPPTLVPCTY